MSGIKSKLKLKWVSCIIIIFLGLLMYGNHLFKERAKALEAVRRKEAVEFMDDGWKKYRMMRYAGANMEYTDGEGSIRAIETEPILLDVYDKVVGQYVLGEIPILGSFHISEGEKTSELIKNFNDNMTHIKIWNTQDNKYRTIAENEGLEEFEDIESFEELWEYMNRRNDENVLYINELETIGYDRTEQDARFIYDYGNGENKELSVNVISLFNLFKDKYKDWL